MRMSSPCSAARKATLGGIVAFEAMWRDYFAFNAGALKLRFFAAEHPFCVILESTAGADAIETFLAACLEDGLIADALIARSAREAREIWSVREGHPIEALPNLLNFDVSLPIGRIGDYAEACTAALLKRWPAAHVSFYGHVGDSNVHICVSVAYAPGEDMHDVDDIVYGVLGRLCRLDLRRTRHRHAEARPISTSRARLRNWR